MGLLMKVPASWSEAHLEFLSVLSVSVLMVTYPKLAWDVGVEMIIVEKVIVGNTSIVK